MDLARQALYVLHIAGVAALLVGFGLQLASGGRAMATMMMHGAGAQLVSGLALVAVNEADDRDLNHTKIVVKLSVTVVVLAIVYLNRERERVPDAVFFGALGLVLANIAIAFGWN